MWPWIINKRLAAMNAPRAPVTPAAIQRATQILFAVFARYGDSVIAFKAIDRFIARYPDKRYLIITTHQALPYAEALIHHPVRLIGINKRRNPFGMWRLMRMLQSDPPDLGFNPWSHGGESEYFISFCRNFLPYRVFANFERNQNLYWRVHEYLQLPMPAPVPGAPLPARAARVVICPFSTDVRKGLNTRDVTILLDAVRKRFGASEIILAGMSKELAGAKELPATRFVLDKSRGASERFIALLKSADLFIGVDAGPLHLADALGVRCVGIFGPTAPETILDRASGIVPLRHPRLDGIFCDVRRCADPVCLHQLLDTLDFDRPAPVDFGKSLHLECDRCAMVVSRAELLATTNPVPGSKRS